MRAKTALSYACLTLVLGLASCGGGDDSTSPPEEGAVHTEAAKSVTKTIGPLGGEVSTTASSGTKYTLTIPEGALNKGTKITMTPVTSIEELGLSGGLAGGVVLQPSGLTFLHAAVLHIETTKSAGTGEQLAGFSSNGDFSKRSLSFAATDGDEIDVLVAHFSAVGAAFGTTTDLASFFTMGSNVLENLISQVLALSQPWDETAAATATQTGHDGYTQVVLPRLQDSANDTDLLDALAAYDRWRFLLALIEDGGEIPIADLNGGVAVLPIPSGFESENTEALAIAAQDLAQAIEGNNGLCKTQQSLAALANVLYWQSEAKALGIDTVDNHLDRDFVLNHLCADVVVEHGELPENLQVGFPHSLDLDFGLLFEGASAPRNAPFFVQVSGVGLDIQNPSGLSDAQGKYTTVVTATQDGGVTFFATASLVLPGTNVGSDVQGVASGGTGSIDITGRWGGQATGIFEGDAELDTNFELHLEQNQNAISGTLSTCDWLGPGTIAATLSGNALLNVSLTMGEGIGACIATGTGSVSGDTITLTLADSECDGGLSFTATLSRGVDACH